MSRTLLDRAKTFGLGTLRALDYPAGLVRQGGAQLYDLSQWAQLAAGTDPRKLRGITRSGDLMRALRGEAPSTLEYAQRAGAPDNVVTRTLSMAADIAMDPKLGTTKIPGRNVDEVLVTKPGELIGWEPELTPKLKLPMQWLDAKAADKYLGAKADEAANKLSQYVWRHGIPGLRETVKEQIELLDNALNKSPWLLVNKTFPRITSTIEKSMPDSKSWGYNTDMRPLMLDYARKRADHLYNKVPVWRPQTHHPTLFRAQKIKPRFAPDELVRQGPPVQVAPGQLPIDTHYKLYKELTSDPSAGGGKIFTPGGFHKLEPWQMDYIKTTYSTDKELNPWLVKTLKRSLINQGREE